MPNESFPAAKQNLAFAKIVANPTPLAWAQIYNAGSLFAGLSLTLPEPNEDLSLQTLGRETFNNLEAEFFSLEEKTLASIQTATTASLSKIPESVTANLCLAYFKDSILYLCIYGAGKVDIKRADKIGTLMEQPTNTQKLISASGLLQNGDIILLQTEQFVQSIPEEIIKKAFELNLPSDIAETLSPHIHEKEEGGAAAIIIAYQGTSAQHFTNTTIQEPQEHAAHQAAIYAQNAPVDTDEFDESEEEVAKGLRSKMKFKLPSFSLPNLKRFHPNLKLPIKKLNTLQKIIALVAILLVIVLTVSITLTKKKQQNAKLTLLFQQTYTPAKKAYDEGKALQNLNQSLAHDDFQKADQTIKANLNQFPPNSTEATQLQSLLTQVDSELGGTTTTDTNKIPTKETTVGDLDMLKIEKNAGAAVVAVNQDDTSVYTLSDKAVTAYNKVSGQKSDIIKNNGDWTAPLSLAPYQGNIYILDKTKGILKYVSGSNGFGKTTYFKDPAPDVSNAKSIAIDSSIYILMQNGTILKYTKGQADTFQISGLDQPLSSPTQIFTTKDIDNIYILDKGNSRIVKLNKSGAFQAKYTADVLNQAQNFEIDDKTHQATILSNTKIYQIPLN